MIINMGSETKEENNEPVLLASIPSGKTSQYATQAVSDWDKVKSEYKLLSLELSHTTMGLRSTNVCRVGARADVSYTLTTGSSSGVSSIKYDGGVNSSGTLSLTAGSGNIANFSLNLYGIK